MNIKFKFVNSFLHRYPLSVSYKLSIVILTRYEEGSFHSQIEILRCFNHGKKKGRLERHFNIFKVTTSGVTLLLLIDLLII